MAILRNALHANARERRRARRRRLECPAGDGRGEGDARGLGLAPVRCRGPVVNCQRVHSHGGASPSSSPAGTDEHAPLRLPYSARRPPCSETADSTGRPLSTNIIVRITPQAAGRVHSHLGDGGGEGDARRLTLALVRCHGPLPLHGHWFLYCYFCTPPPKVPLPSHWVQDQKMQS